MRAVAMFSGGLDSALAIKLIQDQGVEVVALYVDIGFEANPEKREQLARLAQNLGVEFRVVEAVEEYIEKILFSPRYGYGKNMNPCIDCHGFMIKKGFEVMEEVGGRFIITGEVVGQRPMSQRLPALFSVNKLVPNPDLVVRPLSAKLLPPTLPEREGWIDREKLLGISGRGRQVQLQLAKKYNLEGFQSPAGGCLLTDIQFSRRLKNLGKITPAEIPLLRVGRHFKIEGATFIISRHRDENRVIGEYGGDRFIKGVPQFPGPLGVVEKVEGLSPSHFQLLADLVVSYSRFGEGEVLIEGKAVKGRKREKGEWGKYLV